MELCIEPKYAESLIAYSKLGQPRGKRCHEEGEPVVNKVIPKLNKDFVPPLTQANNINTGEQKLAEASIRCAVMLCDVLIMY